MNTEREALLVVREVITRRLVTVMDARRHFEEWRRARAAGRPESFLDHLVAAGAIDGKTRQKILLEGALSDTDAQAEENIRTMVLGQPAAPSQSAARRPAPSGVVPSHTPGSTTPGTQTPGPPSSASPAPAPREDGEVELVTPGGVKVGIEPPIGTKLGRYELLEIVGRGGMGTVYRARINPTEEVVAVKVLGGTERAPSPARRARFRREIMATARLDHPNIVRVRDAGHAGGIEFMVMDFVRGEDLEQAVATGRFSLEERIAIAEQVALGVGHAHERGVIHRDLKPQNVLVDETKVPRVVDFGLAKVEKGADHLTRTGAALGTPYYMAPEQFTGASAVDARADVFSLGVLLYELLALERPFTGASAVEVADKIRNFEPTAPSLVNPQVPKALDAVVARALAKKPEARYANGTELAADIEIARKGGKVTARAPRVTSERIASAASASKAPLFGFLAACVVFIPVIVWLAKGSKTPPGPPAPPANTTVPTVPTVPTPPAPAPAPPSSAPLPPPPRPAPDTPRTPPPPHAQSALDKARAELEAAPGPGELDLPSGDEAASALEELEPGFFAPLAVGDVARAKAGLLASKTVPSALRAELARELGLADRLRALVLLLARLDPGALGDSIDAWGGAKDLGRYPRVLDDESIELREEGRSAVVKPLALASATLARAAADAPSQRGLGTLALARGEPLPAGLREDDARALAAVASWREAMRPAVRALREQRARLAWDALLKDGDVEAWPARFAETAFFAEHRHSWTLLAADRLGVAKLLGAKLDVSKGRLTLDGSEADLLSFDVAFVSTLVRVERSAVGLDLAGVRARLDAGKALSVAATLAGVKGRVGFSLGRHALAVNERGRPSARVADLEASEDDVTADWRQTRKLEARIFEHDPTRVLEVGPPVVMFKLDGVRLAKVPLDAAPPAATPTLELSLDAGRLRSLEVAPTPGALEAALPRLAARRLMRLVERRSETGRPLREASDGRAGLRFEGTWRAGSEGALEAVGPAKLVALVPVETGAAVLALDASAGVTLGWGEPDFPAPLTDEGSFTPLVLAAASDHDALAVNELLRVALPRTKGPRAFTLSVAPGARAAIRGLRVLAD